MSVVNSLGLNLKSTGKLMRIFQQLAALGHPDAAQYLQSYNALLPNLDPDKPRGKPTTFYVIRTDRKTSDGQWRSGYSLVLRKEQSVERLLPSKNRTIPLREKVKGMSSFEKPGNSIIRLNDKAVEMDILIETRATIQECRDMTTEDWIKRVAGICEDYGIPGCKRLVDRIVADSCANSLPSYSEALSTGATARRKDSSAREKKSK